MENYNELILERVRTVEEYDTQSSELTGRYTQIEDPSLNTTADGAEVTDALGTTIATFYNAQKGTFSFTNSLFSLDLAASQFGTTKNIADSVNKIQVPVSETLEIASNKTVTLSYAPVGTVGSEVEFVKVINANNTFGETYKVSTTADAAAKTFTIDASTKKITMPAGVTGRVFVNYIRESENAVSITKTTDGVPAVRKLLVHVIFHDPCDVNIKYAGIISIPRAQIDPSSVELSLKADGKHPASYVLSKEYCSETGKLFDIIVSK